VEAIGSFRRHWSKILRASDFTAGCPIVAAAVEGAHEPTARDIAGEVFAGWKAVIADALRRRGVAAERSRSIATKRGTIGTWALAVSKSRKYRRLHCALRLLQEHVLSFAIGCVGLVGRVADSG
jgi:Transcriptional regulator LmrA/YxaF-like, C-terminal domain